MHVLVININTWLLRSVLTYALLSLSLTWGFFITIKCVPDFSNMPSPSEQLRERMYDLIRDFEGFEPNAYMVDGEDFYTIGYGNTYNPDGSPIGANQTVTREQADGLMRHEADSYYKKLMGIPAFASLPEPTRRSLGSFSYNTGPDWYGHQDFQTLTRAVDSGDTKQIGEAIQLYVNPGTSVTEGLKRRRVAERDLMNYTPPVPKVPTKPDEGMITISPANRQQAKTRTKKFKTGRW